MRLRWKIQLHLLVFLLLCSAIVFTYFLRCCTVNPQIVDKNLPNGPIGLPLSIKLFRTLKIAQEQYRSRLREISQTDKETLEKLTHRSLELNWNSKFGLFPPGKTIPFSSCLNTYSSNTIIKNSVSVSVLIIFKNELASILLRTITSITLRTPPNLLLEIVLVDDGSDQLDCEEEIRDFTGSFPTKLRWFKLEASVGIANARHYGLEKTSGDVVVILDSHMVVSDMWLPPLLEILKNKPRSIAVPLVQMITDQEYPQYNSLDTIPYTMKLIRGYGTFYWSIIQVNKSHPHQPYPSAAVGGGALAAFRSTFLELWPHQHYNSSWGVENVRLALRSWMCGEGVWVSVCSQVVHLNGLDTGLDRYNIYDADEVKKRRVAVGAEIANIMKNNTQVSRLLDSTDFGKFRNEIMQAAQLFSKTLNYTTCNHDYNWYLENVHRSYNYKYFDNPVFEHVGVFQSASFSDQCLFNDFVDSPERTPERLKTNSACDYTSIDVSDRHLIGFSHDPQRVVTVADGYYGLSCWDGIKPGNGAPVKYWGCEPYPSISPPQQKFKYDVTSQQIVHVQSDRCVEIVSSEGLVVLNKCDVNKLSQRWIKHTPSWWRT